MVRLLIPALLLAIAAPAAAVSPIAEVICDSTSALHDRLAHRFGERRSATGVQGPDQIMEVWTDARGDWTLVVTYATGTSCIVAMGKDWATHRHDPA